MINAIFVPGLVHFVRVLAPIQETIAVHVAEQCTAMNDLFYWTNAPCKPCTERFPAKRRIKIGS